LHPANLDSYASLFHVFSRQEFDECYHLAAQSFVAESFADGFPPWRRTSTEPTMS
jgi:GDPmannose 4,6-dehydratase